MNGYIDNKGVVNKVIGGVNFFFFLIFKNKESIQRP